MKGFRVTLNAGFYPLFQYVVLKLLLFKARRAMVR